MKAYLIITSVTSYVVAHYSSAKAMDWLTNNCDCGKIDYCKKIPDITVNQSVTEPCILS